MTDGSDLGGFRRDGDGPPPLPNDFNDWYYVDQGEKKGPVSGTEIKARLARKEIASDSHVWRKGMNDWSLIRNSELNALVDSEPPPLSAELVNNSVVWIIAFLPLITLGIDAFLVANGSHPMQWYNVAMINVPFLGWDSRRLNQAGYSANWIFGAGLILVPVYLFVRAKMLKQFPSYGIVWIVCLVLALLLDNTP